MGSGSTSIINGTASKRGRNAGMATPRFRQSPAASFASFLEGGGRDPREDPRLGDLVGWRSPREELLLRVEDITGGKVRVQHERIAKDMDGKAKCRQTEWTTMTVPGWRDQARGLTVFEVA
jgi:hypothetical protein